MPKRSGVRGRRGQQTGAGSRPARAADRRGSTPSGAAAPTRANRAGDTRWDVAGARGASRAAARRVVTATIHAGGARKRYKAGAEVHLQRDKSKNPDANAAIQARGPAKRDPAERDQQAERDPAERGPGGARPSAGTRPSAGARPSAGTAGLCSVPGRQRAPDPKGRERAPPTCAAPAIRRAPENRRFAEMDREPLSGSFSGPDRALALETR